MDLSSDPANVPRASFSECTPYQTVNFARVAGRFSALRYSAIPCDRAKLRRVVAEPLWERFIYCKYCRYCEYCRHRRRSPQIERDDPIEITR